LDGRDAPKPTQGLPSRWRLILSLARCAAAGACMASNTSCAPEPESKHPEPPQPLLPPQCTGPFSRVDLERVRCDPFVYKPSRDLRHYLVDVRIRTSKPTWLFVGVDAVPARVARVSVDSLGRWWLGGVPARRVPGPGEVLVKDVRLTASDRPEPVALASVWVGGKWPERWLAEGADPSGDVRMLRDPETASLDVYVDCAQWITVRLPSGEPCSN